MRFVIAIRQPAEKQFCYEWLVKNKGLAKPLVHGKI